MTGFLLYDCDQSHVVQKYLQDLLCCDASIVYASLLGELMVAFVPS